MLLRLLALLVVFALLFSSQVGIDIENNGNGNEQEKKKHQMKWNVSTETSLSSVVCIVWDSIETTIVLAVSLVVRVCTFETHKSPKRRRFSYHQKLMISLSTRTRVLSIAPSGGEGR